MIPTLSRITLSLTTFCAVLLGSTMFIGTALPTAAHASLFTSNPCALPCIFDVTPGETLRNDAMMALERQQLSYSFLSETQSASFTTRESRTSRSTLSLLNFGSRGGMSVRALHVYQMGAGNELGYLSDFLLDGYRPNRVLTNCQNAERVYVAFEQPLLLQIVVGEQLRPEDQVMMVASADNDDGVTPLGGFACETESRWMGFASLWKYQQQIAP